MNPREKLPNRRQCASRFVPAFTVTAESLKFS
jgi:hypothetical protein